MSAYLESVCLFVMYNLRTATDRTLVFVSSIINRARETGTKRRGSRINMVITVEQTEISQSCEVVPKWIGITMSPVTARVSILLQT